MNPDVFPNYKKSPAPVQSPSDRFRPYAPMVLRLGLAFVFMWFGLTQLLGPAMWTSLIPAWLTDLGVNATVFVYLNGTFEVVASLLLVLNVWTRWVALLLCLHLVTIILDVGLSAIGVRDIGLAMAALALSLWGKE